MTENTNENLFWSSKKSTTDWIRLDPRWQSRLSRMNLITERMEFVKDYFNEKIISSDVIRFLCSRELLLG
jgi:hypothetical protein